MWKNIYCGGNKTDISMDKFGITEWNQVLYANFLKQKMLNTNLLHYIVTALDF